MVRAILMISMRQHIQQQAIIPSRNSIYHRKIGKFICSNRFDPSESRSNLVRNVSQYDGIYRNARFIHAISTGLIVSHQTNKKENL